MAVPPQIPPEALHSFLMSHPIGKAIAAHTGYGPGHPAHDHHQRRSLAPSGGPVAPSALGGGPGGPPPGFPPPVPGGGMGLPPLGAGPGGPAPAPPMPMPATGGARPPLPPQGAAPQGPPR